MEVLEVIDETRGEVVWDTVDEDLVADIGVSVF